MTDNSAYPVYPHRPNFTDIRTWQVFDAATAGQPVIGTAWGKLVPAATGITCEVGVLCKSKFTGAGKIHISTMSAGTAGTGFQLKSGEQVFVGVRILSDVVVKKSGSFFGAVKLDFIAN
jgi:hypothetical protein